MNDTISVSLENTKMGPIPSFSLLPGVTCAAGCKCFDHGRYAKSICRRYTTVRKAWAKNYVIAQNTGMFEVQMNGWLSILNPSAFRIHVGGDFFSDAYFNAWCEIAKANKKTKFFAFTKQFDIVRRNKRNIPRNLSVILSAWLPNTDGWLPPVDLMRRFPVAWVVKTYAGKGGTYHLDTIYKLTGERSLAGHRYDKIQHCSGRCVECGRCFNLKKKDGDILFELHK